MADDWPAEWDGLSWWRRTFLRATGLYAGYVIRRTGRQVVEIVERARRVETEYLWEMAEQPDRG